ncbi:hypothetical protein FRZ44_02310 [Hypericibacter terrae]|uniref:Cysteine-rich CPCC domain-containing protein n=2 Tax=Hypericibacter terrae TaxID=2602015 RepID=A0A5J6MCJ3_9PROT|nr:hypothetical protein FRZ44_02310 [Hypericibacter terrae]
MQMDGGFHVDMIEVFAERYGKGLPAGDRKAQSFQSTARAGWPRFSLAVQRQAAQAIRAALEHVLHPPITERSMNPFPCPCCGYIVHADPPGSYDICPICFWEDDISQLRFPEMGGANHVSLIQGQRNFVRIGASEERILKHVRKPLASEQRDPDWRPIDPARDQIERPQAGVDYGSTYPADSTRLYYWRKPQAQ